MEAEPGRGGPRRATADRALVLRYALLTAALAVPLLASFATLKNIYPVSSSTMMMGGWGLGRGRTYYILRGETAAGETKDVPLISLVDAMHSRASGLVAAAVENDSLTLPRPPHPSNVALIERHGGTGRLPEAARLPDLLRALGGIHNARLPADSPERLRAIRLDAFRWEGETYEDYGRPVASWREEL